MCLIFPVTPAGKVSSDAVAPSTLLASVLSDERPMPDVFVHSACRPTSVCAERNSMSDLLAYLALCEVRTSAAGVVKRVRGTASRSGTSRPTSTARSAGTTAAPAVIRAIASRRRT